MPVFIPILPALKQGLNVDNQLALTEFVAILLIKPLIFEISDRD